MADEKNDKEKDDDNESNSAPPKEEKPRAAARGNKAVPPPITETLRDAPAFEAKKNIPANFQSDEARDKALTPSRDEEDLGPVLGEVKKQAPPIEVVQNSAYERMVKVKPKIKIDRTCIGGVWYQFKANQETVVPRHVATLLEQKGVI